MELKIFNIEGREVERLTLDPAIWDGRVNLKLLVQAVAMYRTNSRRGTASTKRRGDVSGGGKKPWRQKHTGRARAGSIRSPLWRHGGVVFGPHPRKMSYRLPQDMRRQALLESLKGKLQDQRLIVLDRLEAPQPKTKPFAGISRTFQVSRNALMVLRQPTDHVLKSLRNLPWLAVCRAENLNAFDVLNAQKIVVTKDAFEQLQGRLSIN